ncbi:MAG TPA: hypothetical protein DCM10_19695 [Xanthomarina gelatinilytica]|nr:hypothetical protein [Xanthomarina gelatinilytica]|tara:strand:- start:485 stop:706 length:222 start_codon:yes stop_codon:yes gene_type:complete
MIFILETSDEVRHTIKVKDLKQLCIEIHYCFLNPDQLNYEPEELIALESLDDFLDRCSVDLEFKQGVNKNDYI